jgi:uncharacterized membrane protein YhaH (DUF805 family)
MTRRDYWVKGVLPLLPFGLINSVLYWSNPEEPNPISIVIGLVMMWPSVALYAKRLHDHNRSAWFLATTLIPFAGIVFAVWIIVLCWFRKGTTGPNCFGDDPLEKAV